MPLTYLFGIFLLMRPMQTLFSEARSNVTWGRKARIILGDETNFDRPLDRPSEGE